jgi:hypothetical protein
VEHDVDLILGAVGVVVDGIPPPSLCGEARIGGAWLFLRGGVEVDEVIRWRCIFHCGPLFLLPPPSCLCRCRLWHDFVVLSAYCCVFVVVVVVDSVVFEVIGGVILFVVIVIVAVVLVRYKLTMGNGVGGGVSDNVIVKLINKYIP